MRSILEWFGVKPIPPELTQVKQPLIVEQQEALMHVHEVLEDQRKVAERVGSISTESVRKLDKASSMIQEVIDRIERKEQNP